MAEPRAGRGQRAGVAGPHGVVSIIFNAETAGSDDPTIQTIVTHVKLAK